MSNDKRQNDFAERLRRIEGQRGAEVAPEPEQVQPSNDTFKFDYNPPTESHTIRNAFIWLGFFALFGAGGYVAYNALPEEMVAAVAGLAGFEVEVEGEGPAEEPEEPVMVEETGPVFAIETDMMSLTGPLFASPNVAHANLDGLNLAAVASGVSLPDATTAVSAVLPFLSNTRCEVRQPRPSETVASVRIEDALLYAPIQAFSEEALRTTVLEDIETVTLDGQAFPDDGHQLGRKTSIDVFVTDTTAPVYLVLQNMGSGVIWNVQAAPGAEVAHIAIIAAEHSGVVLPTVSTTFEGLLVSDFLTPYKFGDDSSDRSCMIRPWRAPQPSWVGVQNAALGDTDADDEMFAYREGYAAYNRWYTAAFGVDAGTNVVSARDAAHVLVGPTPATPVPYRTLSGQDVQLMDTDHIFSGDPGTLDQLSRSLHTNLLTAAIGGDVSALDPAPMQRGGQ